MSIVALNHVRNVRAGGFAQAVLLYLADAHNAATGKCCPSREKIAEFFSSEDDPCTVKRVDRALAKLRNLGLIRSTREKAPNGVMNMYSFPGLKHSSTVGGSPHDGVDPTVGGSPHGVQGSDPRWGRGVAPTVGAGTGNKNRERTGKEIFVANAPKSAARAADLQGQPELFQNLEGQSVPVKRSKSVFPPCPYARIVELYHEKLPSLPQVVKITPSRRSAIGARWRDICEDIRSDGDEVTEAKALENFGMFFDRVAHSDYLMGRTPRSSGHQNWRCNLDFLMRQQPFFKVIEGGY